jgi:uncharacterized UPF0146 family protein
MILQDANDIANFVAKTYESARKIIEVGIGSQPWIARIIKENLGETRIIVTDNRKSNLDYVKPFLTEVEIVKDDIFSPRIQIYEGADLVYSIRPPTEIILQLVNLSSRMGFDLLIRPYSDEEGSYTFPEGIGWQQVVHGKSILFLLKKSSFKMG